MFTERLFQIVQGFRTPSRHVLIIDGLDVILTRRDVQYDALAALVLEVSRLNLEFARHSTPIKVVLLCRTDLYERLPGANKNKIRQDSAITLDWYHNPREPGQSSLLGIANLRARRTYAHLDDVVEQFFPATLGYFQGQDPKVFLFELTRHTPRDFLQLLTKIQENAGPGRIREQQVMAGVRDYSMKYFLPEIKDELVGYVPEGDVQPFFDLIGSLRSRDFDVEDLRRTASDVKLFSTIDLDGALRALFECSAIGNVHNRRSGTSYYTFKYRNPYSALSLGDRLLMHKGMWKAMNLI